MDILDTLKKRFSGSTIVIMENSKPRTRIITKTITQRSNPNYSKISSMMSKMLTMMMKKMGKQNKTMMGNIAKKMPHSEASG